MKNLLPSLIVAVVSSLCTFLLCFYFFVSQSPERGAGISTKLVKTEAPVLLNTKPRELINNVLPDFTAVSKEITNSVVNITAFGSTGNKVSSGSGVIVSNDGHIVTNFHVIEEGVRYEITFANKRSLAASLTGVDRNTDIALLKVTGTGFRAIAFGNSDLSQVGEWVLAVGNPFDLNSTVTAGIISAKARNINILQDTYAVESFIQTDAVVNPGNSGGALVNTRGELVGINTAIISESGGYEGYSFAIPSNLVKKVISDIRDYGKVKRAVLGVRIAEINDKIAAEAKLPSVEGVYITSVTRGSSAYDAGLRFGDVIININGAKVNSMSELQEQVALFRPGDRISLEFYREGKKHRADNVVLKNLESEASFR